MRADIRLRLSNRSWAGASFAEGKGGILYAINGALVEDCVFTNANAVSGYYGNSLYVDGDKTIVRDCLIGNVKAGHHSGGNPRYHGLGLYMKGGVVERCVITNCVFMGGHPHLAKGNAVFMDGGTLRSCLVAYNRLSDGWETYHDFTSAAGVYRTGGRIENCTIAYNVAGSGAGGYWSTNADEGACVNTIIYGNKNGLNDDDGDGVQDEPYNDKYTDLYDDPDLLMSNPAEADVSANALLTLYNCMTNNPLFYTKNGVGLQLRNSSPAVNTGITEDWMEDALDLNGEPRVRGRKVDLGCYERQMGRPTIMKLQ